ncbi:hypothetical protein [Arthrobacter sp. Helios]|nr:hypothetical protein [Arthrobacter sp. Helios]UPO78089.1 hypothetical protein ArtHe_05195 [Arthrobacter sp. Helios]
MDSETLDGDMVRELVMESYRLVVAGLPRAERPVDPDSFGKPRTETA